MPTSRRRGVLGWRVGAGGAVLSPSFEGDCPWARCVAVWGKRRRIAARGGWAGRRVLARPLGQAWPPGGAVRRLGAPWGRGPDRSVAAERDGDGGAAGGAGGGGPGLSRGGAGQAGDPGHEELPRPRGHRRVGPVPLRSPTARATDTSGSPPAAGVDVLVRAAQDRAGSAGAGKRCSHLAARSEAEHRSPWPARLGHRTRPARRAGARRTGQGRPLCWRSRPAPVARPAKSPPPALPHTHIFSRLRHGLRKLAVCPVDALVCLVVSGGRREAKRGFVLWGSALGSGRAVFACAACRGRAAWGGGAWGGGQRAGALAALAGV